ADARRDVDRLLRPAAPQERLEQSRRLRDLQLQILNAPALKPYVQRALAFHPGDRLDMDFGRATLSRWLCRTHRVATSSLTFLNCHAQALNLRKFLCTSPSFIPSALSRSASAGALAFSCGPKHP